MKKLKIAVIHPDPVARWSFPLMHDGLRAAMNLIGEKHEVKWFLGGDEPDNSYDWIMPWGVGSMPVNETIEKFSGRKALICAGHPQDQKNFEKFEHIFVESPKVFKEIYPFFKNVSIAFGTDTDFFAPKETEKFYDVFYPATFSDGWKRQSLFAHATYGWKALAAGMMQPDGGDGYRACMENNTYTMVGLIPTKIIADLYNMSKVVCITSWHGSERSALEALAANIPLVITSDNELTCSLVEGHAVIVEPTMEAVAQGAEFALELVGKTNVRSWVLENYSHHKYAQNMLEVLEA